MIRNFRKTATSLALLAVICALGSSPSIADEAKAPGPSAGVIAKVADELNPLFEKQDWTGLDKAINHPANSEEAEAEFYWLRSKTENGGPLAVTILYMQDLWDVAQTVKGAENQKLFSEDAAVLALYSYELITIDGAKCEDRSSPGARFEQLLIQASKPLKYFKALPEADKSRLADAAIVFEKRTAHLRQDDFYICSDGMSMYRNAIEKGEQQPVVDAANPQNSGKTIAVKPSPDWKPTLLPPEKYKPIQEETRSGMKAGLMVLFK